MNDLQFQQQNLISIQQWIIFINKSIEIVYQLISNKINKLKYQKHQKYIPFSKKNQQNLIINLISDLLTDLYKKGTRTNKLSSKLFYHQQLSQKFQYFNFNNHNNVMSLMLKYLPFSFTFESRFHKFKQFIKEDKKKYDRTLFLQENIDQDLIISIRRGYQFIDGFSSCLNKDLRKKYQIIFFNQQGFQQQGIDGGGIIKQFINQILKISFSSIYGLFIQTPLNQMIPNPNCPLTLQYQFIGKLIGKAIYQGIIIQQKFAQPMLNLLIGRQNTFEDLQFIDPTIYKSLLELKYLNEQQLKQLQQTFTILDILPNGNKQYIDLLCPQKKIINNNNNMNNNKQTYLNNNNKLEFILSYTDFKCNKQIRDKTRQFRKGFLEIIHSQWLKMFSNIQLNLIISGNQNNFNINQMKNNIVYNQFNDKDQTIIYFWNIMNQFNSKQKSLFLLFVTSCPRPPTLGFAYLKPKLCITKDNNINHLPTANTCMNVINLPNYKNKNILKKKLIYAINAKAGFQFG